jgi:hypothetical protein
VPVTKGTDVTPQETIDAVTRVASGFAGLAAAQKALLSGKIAGITISNNGSVVINDGGIRTFIFNKGATADAIKAIFAEIATEIETENVTPPEQVNLGGAMISVEVDGEIDVHQAIEAVNRVEAGFDALNADAKSLLSGKMLKINIIEGSTGMTGTPGGIYILVQRGCRCIGDYGTVHHGGECN